MKTFSSAARAEHSVAASSFSPSCTSSHLKHVQLPHLSLSPPAVPHHIHVRNCLHVSWVNQMCDPVPLRRFPPTSHAPIRRQRKHLAPARWHPTVTSALPVVTLLDPCFQCPTTDIRKHHRQQQQQQYRPRHPYYQVLMPARCGLRTHQIVTCEHYDKHNNNATLTTERPSLAHPTKTFTATPKLKTFTPIRLPVAET